MPLTRRSKIKEAWRHPIGHDLLQNMLRQKGRSQRWLTGPLVANLSLQMLDRFAGPGFCDMLIEMAAHEPDYPVHAEAEQQAWWKEAVIYQIYPPSFMDSDHDGMGDLAGITQRLPYLANLGVNVLWLWPVLDEEPCGHGQHSFTKIRKDLGTMADFEELVHQAHARDMRVLMGLGIANTSQQHPWFARALKGEKQGYYVLRPGVPEKPPNNWSRPFGPAWSWQPEIESWALNLGGPNLPDLNWDNPALRTDMAAVLKNWQKKGVDGFTLGPVNMLSKENFDDGGLAAADVVGSAGYERYAYGPRLHRYLRELRIAAPAPCVLAGEAKGVGTEMAKLFTQGQSAELDLLMDPSHLTPRAKNRGEDGQLDLADLKQYYLAWMEQYATQHWMALFLEGPDYPRIVSRLGAGGLYRSILAKLLGTLMFTLRGTPIIYQGGELGLPNTRFTSPDELQDPIALQQYAELSVPLGEREAFQKALPLACDHARTPMPWSAGPKGGFTGASPWKRLPDGVDHLNAAAQMEDAGSVWHHTQKLIALRKKYTCLTYGSFNPVFAKNKKVFCYFRIYEGEKWYVEMNLTEKEVSRPGRILRSQKLALSNYDSPARSLRPYEANLYYCE